MEQIKPNNHACTEEALGGAPLAWKQAVDESFALHMSSVHVQRYGRKATG